MQTAHAEEYCGTATTVLIVNKNNQCFIIHLADLVGGFGGSDTRAERLCHRLEHRRS
jgi:hypothetical protein